MASHARRSSRLGARGAVTWVTVALLLGLTVAGYLAWVWVPVYAVHYEVKAVVKDFGNRAIKNVNDGDLLREMCGQLRALAQVSAPDAEGAVATRPAVDVQPADVVWQRDAAATPPSLHVAFEYRRDVYYPLLERWEEKTMRVDLNLDLSRADWGRTPR
jgi:hypothetical protein